MARLTHLGTNNLLWRRVQRHAQMSAIFGSPQATPTLPGATPSSHATQAVAQPSTSSSRQSWEASTAVVPTGEPPQTLPTAVPPPPTTASSVKPQAAPPDTEEGDANWRRLQTIMQRHRQKQASEKAAAESPQPEADAPTEIATKPAPTLSERSPSPESEQESATAEGTQQNIPLEAAWPIQAKSSPAKPESPTAPAAPPMVQRQPLPKEEATKINKNLESVAPGQQTDSPIETILPSRPRPKQAAKPAAQRDVPAELQVPTSVPSGAQDNEETAVPQSPNTPALIQTEIGSLPADLWETLGEPPPQPTSQLPKAKPPIQSAATSQSPDIQTKKEPTPRVADKPNISMPDTAVPQPAPEPHPPQKKPKSTVKVSETEMSLPQREQLMAKARPVLAQEDNEAAHSQSAASVPLAAPPPNTAVSHTTAQPQPSQPKPAPPLAKPMIQRQATAIAQPEQRQTQTAVETPPTITTLPDQETTARPHNRQEETAVLTPPIKQQSSIEAASAQPSPAQLLEFTTTTIQRLPTLPNPGQIVETAVEALPTTATLLDQEPQLQPEDLMEDEASQEEKINIDDLSRQVYQAIKRKLSVEWERGYGR